MTSYKYLILSLALIVSNFHLNLSDKYIYVIPGVNGLVAGQLDGITLYNDTLPNVKYILMPIEYEDINLFYHLVQYANKSGSLPFESSREMSHSPKCMSNNFILSNGSEIIGKIPIYDIPRNGMIEMTSALPVSDNESIRLKNIMHKIIIKTFLFLFISILIIGFLIWRINVSGIGFSRKLLLVTPLIGLLLFNSLFAFFEVKYLFHIFHFRFII